MSADKVLELQDISIFYQEGRHTDISEHCHVEHQVLFSYTNEFKIFFEGEEVLVPVGKAMFIHSEVMHSFEAQNKNSLQYFIFIKKRHWEDVKSYFQIKLKDLNYFRFSTTNLTKKIMKDVLLSYNEVYQIEMSKMLLANLILEIEKQTKHEMTSLNSKDSILKGVIDHIENNYQTKITTGMLAKTFGISERNLTRKFKNEFGLTIKQYHLQKKIEKAKELVESEDYTLTDIAFDLGFSSLSHFLDTYKKYTGSNPKEL